ncbi:carboxylesterase/lipase family protein [Streptomyces sp. CA-132043]|uniref:carboxylesterase/lipase family protein n=1 Tax=Streptomyces sp. CA-132043 TaxID=3240048 RepID=UPI003D9074A7
MPEQPRVRTAEGVVEGRRQRGHAVFRGIPCAQPPVGALRFAAPVPVRPWQGARQTTEFGPVAPQSGPIRAAAPEDTDWLTRNVCTPDPGRAGLPVLVWITCGGYMAGSSGEPMYDPTALAAAGLVVVSINCRLGEEGFALLDGAPANRGLLDQVAALQWVRQAIARFGGDPDLVTVAGQSGGAGSVAALLTMKPARALFRRAIAHSVPGLHCTPVLAEQVTATLAHRLGTAPTATALAGIAPQRLADELTALCVDLPQFRERWGRLAHLGIAVCPVADGDILTETPWPALSSGRAAGVDLLVGHTRDEFRLFSVMTGRRGTFTEQDARTALDVFAPAPGGPDAYRAAHPHAAPEELLETVYSDNSSATNLRPRPSLCRVNSRKHGPGLPPPVNPGGPPTIPTSSSPTSWPPNRGPFAIPSRPPVRFGAAEPLPPSTSRRTACRAAQRRTVTGCHWMRECRACLPEPTPRPHRRAPRTDAAYGHRVRAPRTDATYGCGAGDPKRAAVTGRRRYTSGASPKSGIGSRSPPRRADSWAMMPGRV